MSCFGGEWNCDAATDYYDLKMVPSILIIGPTDHGHGSPFFPFQHHHVTHLLDLLRSENTSTWMMFGLYIANMSWNYVFSTRSY
jgi:hypothetical protein